MAAGQNAPFVWGSGGRKLTPDQIAKQREIAEAMIAQSGDTSPVGHWTQGAARVAQALAGVVKERRADSAETSANQSGMAALAAAMGGSGGGMAADMPATGAQPSAASPDFSSVQPAEGFQADSRIRDGIATTATALGIDPIDLATAISYETAGTFDPTKRGPTTQWGQHRGLIQFGEPQARENGVNWDDPIGSQLGENGAVANYLRRAGVQPGMGLLDIYSAINAGAPGLYNRSDANNGGAPGTVRDKVEQQMAGHRAKAMAMFPDLANAPGGGAATMAGQMPGDGFQIPGAQGASFDERFATDPSINTFRSGGMQGMTAGNIPGMGEFGPQGAQPANMSQIQGGPLEMGRVIPEGQTFEPMPPDAPGGIVEQALARQGGAPPMDISPPQAAYASQGAPQGAPMAPQQQPMIDPNQYAGGEWIPPDVGRVLAAQQMGQAPAPQDMQSAMVQQGSASPAPAQGGIGGIVQSLLGSGGGQAEMASLGGTPEMQSVVQALGGSNGLIMLAADPSTPASIRQVAMALYEQEQAKNAPVKPMTVNNRLVNPQTGQVIADFSDAPEGPTFRAATPEEAARYGASAGQIDSKTGRFYENEPPKGMTIESDGQGGFRMVQGAGVGASTKPFTEGQSKDVVYATRAEGALEVLNGVAGSLTDRIGRAADYDPTGFAQSGLQTDEYQIAKTAGDEFLQAILRKDTGAAITQDEQILYGATYLPQIGDNPARLQYKEAARNRAVAALRAGMSPAQILAKEKALSGDTARTDAPDVTTMSDDELLSVLRGQ
jgi:hypothetical protein